MGLRRAKVRGTASLPPRSRSRLFRLTARPIRHEAIGVIFEPPPDSLNAVITPTSP